MVKVAGKIGFALVIVLALVGILSVIGRFVSIVRFLSDPSAVDTLGDSEAGQPAYCGNVDQHHAAWGRSAKSGVGDATRRPSGSNRWRNRGGVAVGSRHVEHCLCVRHSVARAKIGENLSRSVGVGDAVESGETDEFVAQDCHRQALQVDAGQIGRAHV